MEQKLPSKLSQLANKQELIDFANEALSYAKKIGASDAYVSVSTSKGISINLREGEIETLEFDHDNTLDIEVYHGKKKASASTSSLQKKDMYTTVEAAFNIAKNLEEDLAYGLPDKELLSNKKIDLQQYTPWNISVVEAVEIAKKIESSCLEYDKKIDSMDACSVSSSQDFTVYANTDGFLGYCPSSSHSLVAMPIAKAIDGSMVTDYYYSSATDSKDLLEPQEIARIAAKRAVDKLNPKKIKTQNAPVIYTAETAKSLFKHILEAISGANIYKKSSFLLDCIDKKVCSDIISLSERPHILKDDSSSAFDAEGVATYNKEIITDGVLNTYLLGSYSARKLNLKSTANAGGVYNLLVGTQDLNFNDLVKKMHKGLIVTDFLGTGVNIVSGTYSRGVAGFWVENGEIQYPVNEVTIAGNLGDMLKSILAVANDIDYRGSIKTGSILINNMTIAGN